MHSIDDLITVAVDGDEDDRWTAIEHIRSFDAGVVFERAATMCRSSEPRRRSAGAEILGQLPDVAREALSLLETLLDDDDGDVVAAAVLAFAHQREMLALEQLIALTVHGDAKVRWALVTALEGAVADERAERALLRLMADADPDVRDRATFAIGSLSETDTPRVRAALAERLLDESTSVAREAALGLARRHDARAIPFIARAVELADDEIEEAVDEITSPAMLADLMKARPDAAAARGVDSLIARCRARQ